MLEETFQTGAAILTNMAGQRERLKVQWSLSGYHPHSCGAKGIVRCMRLSR